MIFGHVNSINANKNVNRLYPIELEINDTKNRFSLNAPTKLNHGTIKLYHLILNILNFQFLFKVYNWIIRIVCILADKRNYHGRNHTLINQKWMPCLNWLKTCCHSCLFFALLLLCVNRWINYLQWALSHVFITTVIWKYEQQDVISNIKLLNYLAFKSFDLICTMWTR